MHARESGYEDDLDPTQSFGSPNTGGVFKITADTTTGYFELPNYMNGGQAGPLIDGDPDDDEHCGYDCQRQVYGRGKISPRAVPPVSNLQSNSSLSLSTMSNRGVSRIFSFTHIMFADGDMKQPLLTVVIALFGYDSFISTRLTHQETFIRDYDS